MGRGLNSGSVINLPSEKKEQESDKSSMNVFGNSSHDNSPSKGKKYLSEKLSSGSLSTFKEHKYIKPWLRPLVYGFQFCNSFPMAKIFTRFILLYSGNFILVQVYYHFVNFIYQPLTLKNDTGSTNFTDDSTKASVPNANSLNLSALFIFIVIFLYSYKQFSRYEDYLRVVFLKEKNDWDPFTCPDTVTIQRSEGSLVIKFYIRCTTVSIKSVKIMAQMRNRKNNKQEDYELKYYMIGSIGYNKSRVVIHNITDESPIYKFFKSNDYISFKISIEITGNGNQVSYKVFTLSEIVWENYNNPTVPFVEKFPNYKISGFKFTSIHDKNAFYIIDCDYNRNENLLGTNVLSATLKRFPKIS